MRTLADSRSGTAAIATVACAAALRSVLRGHIRRCQICDAQHFPRSDPAVIVLVTHRHPEHGERCLLGRSTRFPAGLYSTLAGFVEPGESLEETVRREVYEEAGVEVVDMQYRSSQPWPFPASLMLGFRAMAQSDELRIDPEELVDAGWYTRAADRSGPPPDPAAEPGLDRPTPDRGLAVRGPALTYSAGSTRCAAGSPRPGRSGSASPCAAPR